MANEEIKDRIYRIFSFSENKTGNNTSTNYFYENIQEILEDSNYVLNYCSFDLDDPLSYLMLSPPILINAITYIDANTLNQAFYDELLYILGLEEVEENGRAIIIPSNDKNTLLDSICNQFKLNRKMDFEIIFRLIIQWNNRILFLRLLESMLLNFKHIEKCFLSIDSIPTFSILNKLFFEVLAIKEEERVNVEPHLASLPYLNSSLFEKIPLEVKGYLIKHIESNSLPTYKYSILEDRELPLLNYLFAFLHAYDFKTTPSDVDDILNKTKSTLINPSILGLVFEKLNGYKEGSFYTPSFITSFMCKDSIQKVLLDRFNTLKNWDCKSINDLHNKIQDLNEANEIFHSIRICDPSVGSGHFLVSVLNELIYLKYNLGLLLSDGRKIKDISLELVNDEIIIRDENNKLFSYTKPSHEKIHNHLIQKALFETKKDLIENCLFGVDINPNSCEITKLRLWIELLKSSHYIFKDSKNTFSLNTLPNIDINIKCGDALIDTFDIHLPLNKNLSNKIKEYKSEVSKYKNQLSSKKSLLDSISLLKEALKSDLVKNTKEHFNLKENLSFFINHYGSNFIDFNDEFCIFLLKLAKECAISMSLNSNFSDVIDVKESEILLENMRKDYLILKDILDVHRFEWRLEFPEVLDDEGNFIGFDLIIGNPPYIRQEEIKDRKQALKERYKIFDSRADIYTYFFEKGFALLKKGGYLSLVTSNKWTRAKYGKNLRELILEKSLLSYTDLTGAKVFAKATVDVSIILLQKSPPKSEFIFNKLETTKITSAYDMPPLLSTSLSFSILNKEIFSFSTPEVLALKEKIEAIGTPLKDWDININRGIITGYNEAFIITTEKRDEILKNCKDKKERDLTSQLIKKMLRGRDIRRYSYKWDGLWVIVVGFGAHEYLAKNYPSIYEHLKAHEENLKSRGQCTNKPITSKKPYPGQHHWLELDNNPAPSYLSRFEKEKIVWAETSNGIKFSIDLSKYFLDKTCFMLCVSKDYLYYFYGVLNSKIASLYIQHTCSRLGKNGFSMSKIYIEKLPIPKITSTNKKLATQVATLAREITELKKQDKPTQDLESKIDSLIYELYQLTPNEIAIIESS